MKVLARYLHESDRGKTILDCGSGEGAYVLQLMQRFHLDAYGVEYQTEKVEKAASDPRLQNRVEQGDLGSLRFKDNSFDYALLNEVLEHVPDDRLALSEINRVLKQGGLLFVFSPNRCFPIETHGVDIKLNGRHILMVPFIPYLPTRLGQHLFRYWARNYWPWELAGMMRKAGFTVLAHGSIALTFENISLGQPFIIRVTKPVLRKIGNLMEKLPFLKHCGASQFLVGRKVVDAKREHTRVS